MSKRTLTNLIISASIFAIVVGGVLFAFFHVLHSSQTLEEQIAAVAAQTQQEETLLRLQRIAQNSVEARDELGSYFLLRESDSIAFLSEIETIAPTVGVDLETTGLVQITQDNKDWIQATFSITGSRENVQRFVQILENIPYVSRITSVNMTGNTAGSWQADIVIQVQLLSYD